MTRKIRYLSHPQVTIDPSIDIQNWSLSTVGRTRVEALTKSSVLNGTRTVISSAETKAIETARPLADAFGCTLIVREAMHENDRSATGFLPPDEFEAVADQFFGSPTQSVRGWETALDAQLRIVGEMTACLKIYTHGDLLFVGHGGVGTLLYCHLAGVPINRQHDQGPGGGGCYFEFSSSMGPPNSGWRPMEDLLE